MVNKCLIPLAAIALAAVPAGAQPLAVGATSGPTYADLADLADAATLVIHAKIRSQAQLKPERAPGLAPGFARLYIEADTISLLTGNVPVGESLKYLVDVPLESNGRPPKLKKREFILFAKPVPGRPGEVQLVGPTSQLAWTPEREAQLRPILTELIAPDSPPAITGVRDALSVAGNLTGESETQIFLSTANEGPVSITVARRPGMRPVWGVSWTEIVDQAARPPQRDTLAWYRLACFMPPALPTSANLSRDPEQRRQAAVDYRFVLDALGPCVRGRG